MNFKNWVKSIQTAAYNGARTVLYVRNEVFKGCLISEDFLNLKNKIDFVQ